MEPKVGEVDGWNREPGEKRLVGSFHGGLGGKVKKKRGEDGVSIDIKNIRAKG